MMNSNEFSWRRLIQQAQALLESSQNPITNAANLSALLFQELADISWAGFYFFDGKTLELGPFQGKPACVSINLGEGVCGTAALSGKSIRVADVDTFDGHIVCDVEARSELVVPLFKNDQLLGVLDVDSARIDRFSGEDEDGLHAVADLYLASIV